MKTHLLTLLFIFNIALISCQSTQSEEIPLSIEELKIIKVESLVKEKEALKKSKKNSKSNYKRVAEIDNELKYLTNSLCDNSTSKNDCSECTKCNSNCSLEEKAETFVNCLYKKGVLAGGKCNSCPTIPIKNILIRNPYTINNNIITRITFTNAKTNTKINTVTLGSKKAKKIKKRNMYSKNIEHLKINTSQKYNITVEEIMPNKTVRTFTIKNYAFNRKK